MRKLNSLRDVFEVGIIDIYDAENQILIAMPKMIKRVGNKTLRTILESHLQETAAQVQRLEQVLQILRLRPDARFSAAMQAILKEGMDLLREAGPAPVLDAACIAAAHMIEHYEIGAYSMLTASCRLLDYPSEVFSLLCASEQEERDADAKLFEVAAAGIYAEAMASPVLVSD
jgi:ferritin-like metal-binding protein YciE